MVSSRRIRQEKDINFGVPLPSTKISLFQLILNLSDSEQKQREIIFNKTVSFDKHRILSSSRSITNVVTDHKSNKSLKKQNNKSKGNNNKNNNNNNKNNDNNNESTNLLIKILKLIPEEDIKYMQKQLITVSHYYRYYNFINDNNNNKTIFEVLLLLLLLLFTLCFIIMIINIIIVVVILFIVVAFVIAIIRCYICWLCC